MSPRGHLVIVRVGKISYAEKVSLGAPRPCRQPLAERFPAMAAGHGASPASHVRGNLSGHPASAWWGERQDFWTQEVKRCRRGRGDCLLPTGGRGGLQSTMPVEAGGKGNPGNHVEQARVL